MTKGACRTLQLVVASLALCSCALPEVATWVPPVETMPAQPEVAPQAEPAVSDEEVPDSGTTSSSNASNDAGPRDSGASASSDAASAGQSATPAAGSAAAVSGSAGTAATKTAPCVCAAGSPCCDGCNLLADGASCAFAGPSQCLDGGVCKAGLCTPKIKPTFCFVSNMCYREGDAAPRYDCLYCAPKRVQDRFSPRPAGTRCDDKVYCNGTDACGPYGQCTDSSGPPCPDGWTCEEANDTCYEPAPPSEARSGD